MARLLVFDNTPLSHFARAGRLSTLEALGHSFSCVTPTEVLEEITAGIGAFPEVSEILNASWLEPVEISGPAEFTKFAQFKSELGGGQKDNNGEAAVLAWASTHGATAILDERAGTRLARREGIEVHGSLWLIVQGLRSEALNRDTAERLVDDLRASGMRLPIDGAALFAWAYQEGLLG